MIFKDFRLSETWGSSNSFWSSDTINLFENTFGSDQIARKNPELAQPIWADHCVDEVPIWLGKTHFQQQVGWGTLGSVLPLAMFDINIGIITLTVHCWNYWIPFISVLQKLASVPRIYVCFESRGWLPNVALREICQDYENSLRTLFFGWPITIFIRVVDLIFKPILVPGVHASQVVISEGHLQVGVNHQVLQHREHLIILAFWLWNPDLIEDNVA